MVTHVSHSTSHFRPVCLFIFSFPPAAAITESRVKATNFHITFSLQSSASPSAPRPAVLKIAPRKIYDLPTVDWRKNRIDSELALQVPVGPLMVGPGFKGERETQYEKLYQFSTVGNFWSSKMGSK